MTDREPVDQDQAASGRRYPEPGDELRRQRRVVDQMSTMHALLRDRYRLQATTLKLGQLVLSVVATAFAFAGKSPSVTILGLTAERAVWLGWLAVVILSLAMTDLVLDSSGDEGRHDSAVRQLAVLKSGYRVDPQARDEEARLAEMSERYETTMDGIPQIPERAFNRLKAEHLRKVEVSRHLSDNPGMSVWRARRDVRRRAHEQTE